MITKKISNNNINLQMTKIKQKKPYFGKNRVTFFAFITWTSCGPKKLSKSVLFSGWVVTLLEMSGWELLLILCRYFFFLKKQRYCCLSFQYSRVSTKHLDRISRRRIFSPEKVTFSVKIRKRCQLVKSAVFFLHFCELKNTVFFVKKKSFFFP